MTQTPAAKSTSETTRTTPCDRSNSCDDASRSAEPFDPSMGTRFVFGRPAWDPGSGNVDLPYTIEMANGDRHEFCERYRFPPVPEAADRLTHVTDARDADRPASAVRRAVRLLHFVAGVSYYKAACPPIIAFDHDPPNQAEAAFLARLYLHGLGEFAHVNRLDLRDRLVFAGVDAAMQNAVPDPAPPGTGVPRRWLVPIGGGKDSLVTAELLARSGAAITPAVVGSNPVVHRVAEHVARAHGVRVLHVERRIDPVLFDLNARGAWNGHVPVTAIVSLAMVVAAAITGHDGVAMSNERSANIGEVVGASGEDVNHQHSKGLAFERDLRSVLVPGTLYNPCNPNKPGSRDSRDGHDSRDSHTVSYTSLLRPLSELGICRIFATMPGYHRVFTSCNANFRHSATDEATPRWCNACPKCRFVFLAMAPWLQPSEMIEMFGENLLDSSAQLDGYQGLLGAPGTTKPFECVGQIDECRAAFEMLLPRPAWRHCLAVRWYAEHMRAGIADPKALVARALAPSDEHTLSDALRAVVFGADTLAASAGGTHEAG